MSGGKTVVELRVHGVSGTPPEAMLNCPSELLARVSGGSDAGFYRRADWVDDVASPPVSGAWRRLMEAYSWGGLTSGRASRALWLLFLPFTLVNLAHWMLPPAQRKLPASLAVALMRLLALSFTLTLLLAMAVVVLDVAVWQCAGLDYCSSGRGPLAFLAARPAGERLAYGALPLVLVIVVLWRLGREEVDTAHDPRTPPEGSVMAGSGTPLAEDTFWLHDDSVRRLRVCHVTAWASGLAALVLAVPVRHPGTDGVRATAVLLLIGNLVLLAVAVAATAWNKATARGGPGAGHLHNTLIATRLMALILLGVSVLWVARTTIAYPEPPTHLPGLRGTIYGLLAVQAVLLIGLFGCTALSMRARRTAPKPAARAGYAATLRGYTGPFVVLLGWMLGGGLSVGIGLGAAQVLGKVVVSTAEAAKDRVDRMATLASATQGFDVKMRAAGGDAALIVPPPYLWTAVATAFLLVVVLTAGVYTWVRILPVRTEEFFTNVQDDYPVPATSQDGALYRRIARARALASLTDVAVKLLGGLVLVAVGVIVGMAGYYVSREDRFDQVVEWSPHITNVSVFVIVALAAGTGLVVLLAYRNPQLRKTVAILWDVATFWPRANHPLTPPSYGKRTVWDLRLRLAALDTANSKVVLVAHSQGTIIAAATLLQATGFDGADEQYPLLTFGSPLRRLYAQNFPAYFGSEAMDALQARQSEPARRWINLWVCSDPIGAWVFDTAAYVIQRDGTPPDLSGVPSSVDGRIPDVAQQDPLHKKFGADPFGPVCGHSGFWDRSEYDMAVDALQAVVAPGAVDSGATTPPKPETM